VLLFYLKESLACYWNHVVQFRNTWSTRTNEPWI